MLSWLTFLIWALIRSLLLPRFDLIVTLTSPPFLGLIGWAHKTLRGSKFWSWEMDVYPDVAVGVGLVKETSISTRVTDSSTPCSASSAGRSDSVAS